ncbi:MAG: putative toxin-antitoxin system toxin component, PIN family [Myxococcota bacterium]|nr:putative toxin-antitoxin system toxin component, PIN family [Myxococcota bacterium]
MRLVVDTNVLVSALLKPGSVPDRLLARLEGSDVEVVFDARIEDEWARVIARKKFAHVPRERGERLLAALRRGTRLEAVPAWSGEMIDDDDRMFVEVAHAAGAAIVTGNVKHFPAEALPVEVHRPAALLDALTGE